LARANFTVQGADARRHTSSFSIRVVSSFETPRRGAAPQDEVLDPHGEERGNAVRLEP